MGFYYHTVLTTVREQIKSLNKHITYIDLHEFLIMNLSQGQSFPPFHLI